MSNFTKLKNKIQGQIICLQLILSLLPKDQGITNKELRDSLLASNEFVKNADKTQIKKIKELSDKLQKSLIFFNQNALLKGNIDEIALSFDTYYLKNQECYTYGVEYGWLNDLIDCSKLGYPSDLPYQTRIGIGHHAGALSVEEGFLLHDSFYLLLKARESFNDLSEYSKKWAPKIKSKRIDDVNHNFGIANQNVAIHSRLCILSFYSFLESFVNSVGYDYFQKNKLKLSQADIETLSGQKKGQFISLEKKIEKFPTIIRDDKKPVIITSDPQQIREPFKSIFGQMKEIRNSSVHHSPLKTSIWRLPSDWLNDAEQTSKNCIEAASNFWIACYPNSKGPTYLHNLDFKKYLDLANEAMEWKKSLDGLERIDQKNTKC